MCVRYNGGDDLRKLVKNYMLNLSVIVSISHMVYITLSDYNNNHNYSDE